MPKWNKITGRPTIWAASWQNQQNGMSAQRRLRSTWASAQSIRVFAVRMKKAWVNSYPLSAQQRLWSDWTHMPFCWFCHETAHMYTVWLCHMGTHHTVQKMVKNIYRFPGWPGVRNFPGWPGKMTSRPEVRFFFSQPEKFGKSGNFSLIILWLFFINFHLYLEKSAIFSPKLEIFYFNCQSLRPIFMAARISIFGEMVTLESRFSIQEKVTL